MAPGAKIGMVKVAVDDATDPNFGLVLPDAVVCGIDWAIGHNFDLINASLTVDPFTAPFDDIFCSNEPDRAAIVQIVRTAILKAAAKKITVIAATGNFFLDLANLPGSGNGVNCKVLPVSLPKVIGVSAVGYTQQLSWYSDYGLGGVDLTGPGGDNLIPDPLVTDTAASGQVLATDAGRQPLLPGRRRLRRTGPGLLARDPARRTRTSRGRPSPRRTSPAWPRWSRASSAGCRRILLLAKLSLAAHPIACPPSPYDPGATGQPATCKGPAFYNSFYGAGEVDALAALK